MQLFGNNYLGKIILVRIFLAAASSSIGPVVRHATVIFFHFIDVCLSGRYVFMSNNYFESKFEIFGIRCGSSINLAFTLKQD